MSAFFYCVIVPAGDGQEIYAGRINAGNASEALGAIEMLHPDAMEIRIKKQKVLNEV